MWRVPRSWVMICRSEWSSLPRAWSVSWKEQRLFKIPVFKIEGCLSMGNYHPVSVFPSESKSFEEVIVDKRSLYFLFICKLIASYSSSRRDMMSFKLAGDARSYGDFWQKGLPSNLNLILFPIMFTHMKVNSNTFQLIYIQNKVCRKEA